MGIVVTESVLAGERFKNIRLFKSTIEFKQDVVLLNAVAVVPVEGLKKDLELRLHASADRVAEDELLCFTAQKT